MKIRVVTLSYSAGLQGFPEDALQRAVSGHEVLEVREHFFVHAGTPRLALVCLLGEGEAEGDRRRESAPDPSKDLPESLRPLYRSLREWRNRRAKEEGIPSYIIMRNALLAEICRRLPRTMAELREVEGVGESACAKYGEDVLNLIPPREEMPATETQEAGDK